MLPILALALVAWQVWSELLGWSDLIVFAIMYVADRPRHHRSASTACSRTARSRPARPCARILAALGSAAIEGPVISWVADHRKHHALLRSAGRSCTRPRRPRPRAQGALRGLLHAHVGWLFIHTRARARRRATRRT